jgi:hypothetical protein
VGKFGDEPVGVGCPCCLFDTLLRGPGRAVRYVGPDRIVEEDGLLRDDPQGSTETAKGEVPDIGSIHGDAPLAHLVEAGEKIQEGGLTGP